MESKWKERLKNVALTFAVVMGAGNAAVNTKQFTAMTNPLPPATDSSFSSSTGIVNAGVDPYPINVSGFNIGLNGKVNPDGGAVSVQYEYGYNEPGRGPMLEWHVNMQGPGTPAVGFRPFFGQMELLSGRRFALINGQTSLCNSDGHMRMEIPDTPLSPIRVTGNGIQIENNAVPAIWQKRTDGQYEQLLNLWPNNRTVIAGAFGGVDIGGDLRAQSGFQQGGKLGFFNATTVNKATSVAVTPESIHAELVRLGLFPAP